MWNELHLLTFVAFAGGASHQAFFPSFLPNVIRSMSTQLTSDDTQRAVTKIAEFMTRQRQDHEVAQSLVPFAVKALQTPIPRFQLVALVFVDWTANNSLVAWDRDEDRDALLAVADGLYVEAGKFGGALIANAFLSAARSVFMMDCEKSRFLSTHGHQQHFYLCCRLCEIVVMRHVTSDEAWRGRALSLCFALSQVTPHVLRDANLVDVSLQWILHVSNRLSFSAKLSVLELLVEASRRQVPLMPPSMLLPLFAPFCDVVILDGTTHDQRMIAKSVILTLASGWQGFFLIASSSPMTLKPMIHSLLHPGNRERKLVIFELLMAILAHVGSHLRIATSGPWSRPSATTAAIGDVAPADEFEIIEMADDADDDSHAMETTRQGEAVHTGPQTYHRRDALLVAWITLLYESDLLDTLRLLVASAAESSEIDPDITESAMLLTQRFLVVMQDRLPSQIVEGVQRRLNEVIAAIALGNDPRSAALTTRMFHLLAYGPDADKNNARGLVDQFAAMSQSSKTALALKTRTVVRTSCVVEYEPDRWNFLLLRESAPVLTTPAAVIQFKEARFFERFFAFFRPAGQSSNAGSTAKQPLFRTQFRSMKRKATTDACGKAALSVIEALLNTTEGIAVLQAFDVCGSLVQFITEITGSDTYSLASLKQENGFQYFHWISRLTEHHQGLPLLHGARFFDVLKNLVESTSLPADATDIVTELLDHIHFGAVTGYGIDKQATELLFAAIRSRTSTLIRLRGLQLFESYVTRYLQQQVPAAVQLLASVIAREKTASTVVRRALSLLAGICHHSSKGLTMTLEEGHLDNVLKALNDSADGKWKEHVRDGLELRALMFEVLGVDSVLDRTDAVGQAVRRWTEAEIQNWSPLATNSRSVGYAIEMDLPCVGVSNTNDGAPLARKNDVGDRLAPENGGAEPVHIGSMLGRTSAGCRLLRTSALFERMIQDITEPFVSRAASSSPGSGDDDWDNRFNSQTMYLPAEDGSDVATVNRRRSTALTTEASRLSSCDTDYWQTLAQRKPLDRLFEGCYAKDQHQHQFASLRASLYVWGHCCSSDVGFTFMLDNYPATLTCVLSILNHSPHHLVSAAAFVSVSTAARSSKARKVLESKRCLVHTSNTQGRAVSVCLPVDPFWLVTPQSTDADSEGYEGALLAASPRAAPTSSQLASILSLLSHPTRGLAAAKKLENERRNGKLFLSPDTQSQIRDFMRTQPLLPDERALLHLIVFTDASDAEVTEAVSSFRRRT